jgi:choline monooxygenase
MLDESNQACFKPERTIQETEWYFPNETSSQNEREVMAFVNVLREEDILICESVQRGLHSLGHQQGRFIVEGERTYVSEHAVQDFQLNVAPALHESP